MGSGVDNRGSSACKNPGIECNQSWQRENKQKIIIITKPWGPVGQWEGPNTWGPSLAWQWLRLPASTMAGGRFSLWWEKKIAYATQPKNKQYSKVLEKWPNICIILSSKRRGGSRAERVFREICDSSQVRYHDGGVSRGQTTDRDKRGENPQTDPHRHAPLFCDGSKSAKDN